MTAHEGKNLKYEDMGKKLLEDKDDALNELRETVEVFIFY